ncbi:MAG: glycosyl hydrolase family 28-related protein, partial [Flavobacteriales bacterium]
MIRFLAAFFLGFSAFGQVLPSSRSVDWTVAGLTDTSTEGFTYYNAVQEGVIPDGVTSANAVIDSLLQLSQAAGIHIHFPAGTYFFNAPISLPSNCLISGDGATATYFVFNQGGTGHSIQTNGALQNADTASVVVQGVKGTSYLVVSNTTPFQAGDWIKVIQQDADLVFSSWAQGSVGQLININSISGDTLWLNSELRMDCALNRQPKVKRVLMKRNIGLQCFSIERMDNTAPEQASVIHFTYAENCWVCGIESNKTTFAHVEFEGVSNSKVEKSYFHDAFEYGGGGRGYGVVMHFTTNECLIENNIFKHLRHSVLLQAGSNGNVTAFNHSLDPYWTNSNPLLAGNSAGELVLHGNYVFANLFEQNDVQNIVIDNSHGANGPYNTFLRNRASLYGIFFSDNTSPSQNFIGNEIPNTSFPYSAVNYSIQGNDQFTYGNNNKGTVAPAGTSALSDISYHYLTKPAFVQEYKWGMIGLPSAMNTASVPATDRYEAND